MKTGKLMEELFGQNKKEKKKKEASENPLYGLMLDQKQSKEMRDFNE